MVMPQRWQRNLKPDQGVLELLESLLDAARKGHLRALAVVAVNPLLETEVGWRAQGDRIQLEAAAAVLLCKRRGCERRQPDLGWKTALVGADRQERRHLVYKANGHTRRSESESCAVKPGFVRHLSTSAIYAPP